MSQKLRCANGHEWERSTNSQATNVCPICGSIDTTMQSPPMPNLPSPLRPNPDELSAEPLPIIPGYEIEEEVGRGGMGVVYRAVQTAHNRRVALKVIRQDRLTNPEAVQRFRREARAAARLSHPNVVAIYESDQEGTLHYLALEYVPGVTLQQMVEAEGPLDAPLACDLIRQVALGLQHAVEQGLVHRDIKPSNLMVVMPGKSTTVRPLLKLLDMGVARLSTQHHEESVTTLTRDGVVLGTPDYIAPEQLENPKEADIRADLYSLGCTFYFLLTGQVPFPGGSLIQKLDKQRWHTAPSAEQIRPSVPKKVAAIVRRLMAKHPDDRFASPNELADSLCELTKRGELPKTYEPTVLSPLRVLEGHNGASVDAIFDESGATIYSAGVDRTIRVWDTDTGTQNRTLLTSPAELGCLAWTPRGQLLVGQGVSVRLYDVESVRELLRLEGHIDAVRSIAVSSDGRQALTAGDDRKIRLWDLVRGRAIFLITGCRGRISSIALSHDGRLAVTGDHQPALRLWDVDRGQEMRRLAMPRGPVLSVAVSPSGRMIASGHFDTTLRLWDTSDGREVRRLKGHRQMVSGVAFAPNDRMVASSSHDGTIVLWDILSGAEICCCRGHSGPVTAVRFSPDGALLLSTGNDGTLRLWQVPR